MSWIPLKICFLLELLALTQAFDYSLNPSSTNVRLELVDESTGISNIKTLFIAETTHVTVQGISWLPNNMTEENWNKSHVMEWTTYVDGIVVETGTVSLMGIRRQLPTQISTGALTVESRGLHNITIRLVVDESELIVTEVLNAYQMWISTVPLLVVLLLAICTNMVRREKRNQ
jgi:hypothetical protein